MRARSLYRAALLVAVVGVGLGVSVGPAAAHVEVSADKPQAGATNVTLTFVGEAESTTSGIASERVYLPTGMKPSDVTLAKAPAGWKLTTNPDGFTIAGKALGAGTDATFAVKVAQLPSDATRLAFKTVETYADGKVSRWIGIQADGAEEPENPAPTLQLRPAASTAPATPTATTNAPTPSGVPASDPASVPASAPATTVQAVPTAGDEGGAGWILWLVVGVLAAAAAVAAVIVRRRRSTDPAA